MSSDAEPRFFRDSGCPGDTKEEGACLVLVVLERAMVPA